MTQFEEIYDRFENKMEAFKGYFDISEGLDIDLINERNKSILYEAIDQFQEKIVSGQKVDFYDHDGISFNFDLTSIEKSLLSDMMVLVAIEREASTLLETCLVLSSDAKSWSPNEGRKTFMDMWESRRLNFENRMQKYNIRDRLTGEIIPDFDYSSLE